MKKMTLKVDDLRVDSFATSTERTRSGTVAAHESRTDEMDCQPGSNDGTCESTCYQLACGCTENLGTCNMSCGVSCNGAETCYQGCETYTNCPSSPGYPGCSGHGGCY
jgi:hypothetical protein